MNNKRTVQTFCFAFDQFQQCCINNLPTQLIISPCALHTQGSILNVHDGQVGGATAHVKYQHLFCARHGQSVGGGGCS